MAAQLQERERTAFAVPGLESLVEIVVDRWGVPHIYATDTYDTRLGGGRAVRGLVPASPAAGAAGSSAAAVRRRRRRRGRGDPG
ncbi:MAG: penicillin acylase family protein, partial [Saccharopolyspora sp.]|uniref:penicillin acylase family protein n=1 Tax=Saccharopolyspora sp. TaxID=33915 RepID=UPI0025D9A49F